MSDTLQRGDDQGDNPEVAQALVNAWVALYNGLDDTPRRSRRGRIRRWMRRRSA
jgi:hypothetical protein